MNEQFKKVKNAKTVKKENKTVDYSVIKIVIFLAVIPVFFVIFICLKECKNPFIIDLSADQWTNLFGGFLSYVGTCAIGIVAFIQNNKMNKLNKQLAVDNAKFRKVELASYLSFINITNIGGGNGSNMGITEGINANIIDLNDKRLDNKYYVTCLAENKSKYPITCLEYKITSKANQFVLRHRTGQAQIYIGAEETSQLTIITPLDALDNKDEEIEYRYELYFNNVMGFKTKGIIELKGYSSLSYKSYKIAQYTDINPYNYD